MNSWERVATALQHETPDRCPFQASFTPEFAARLRAHVGLSDDSQHNPHGGGNTYALERAIGEDMLLTSVGWANGYYQDTKPYVDEWGVGWDAQPYDTPFGRGHYTEITRHPLAGDHAIAGYQPPDPHELGRDGGLILAPTHNVQLDTPLSNFWALVETVHNTPYAARATASARNEEEKPC